MGKESEKESTCQCRRHGRCGFNPWIGKIPRSRKWQTTPVSLPGGSPRTGESGWLEPMGSQRVGHGWADMHAYIITDSLCHTPELTQRCKSAVFQHKFLPDHRWLPLHAYWNGWPSPVPTSLVIVGDDVRPELSEGLFFPFSGLWDSSLPRDWTWAMAVKALSPNQWTARKFPQKHLLGMQSWIITLENSSVISYKVKNTYFTTQEPLLGVYPKEMKRFTHAKTCLQMFIVALFITTTNWKQSRCLSTGEGMKRNVVNPYTGILLGKK